MKNKSGKINPTSIELVSLSVFHLRRAGGPGLRTGGRKLEAAVGSGAVADEGGRGPRSAAGSLSDPSPLRFVTTAKGQREAEDEDEPPPPPSVRSAASDVASSTTPRWFIRSLGLKTSAVEWSFPLLPSLFHSFVPFGKGESGERRRVSERATHVRRERRWMDAMLLLEWQRRLPIRFRCLRTDGPSVAA